MKIIVILNNIRSSENVGSIFRTSDAAGVLKIFLAGITPGPLDRFERENKSLTKASLGAEKIIQWERFDSLKEIIERMKAEDFLIVGVEQSINSIDYRHLKVERSLEQDSKVALVFGNEVSGLSEDDLKLCDVITEIRMRGQKESLNVSVSAGIMLFYLI